MKPAAFLFDLDGTLVDTEALWTEAIVEWLADRGASTTVEAVSPVVFGHSWLDIQSTLHERFPQLPEPLWKYSAPPDISWATAFLTASCVEADGTALA